MARQHIRRLGTSSGGALLVCRTYPTMETSEMLKDIGIADRLRRTVMALVVAALYFAGQISGAVALILGAPAVIFLSRVLSDSARSTPHSSCLHARAIEQEVGDCRLPVMNRVGCHLHM